MLKLTVFGLVILAVGLIKAEQDVTSDSNTNVICNMSSSAFLEVCRELFRGRLSMYKLDETVEPPECFTAHIHVFTGEGPRDEMNNVRKCPSPNSDFFLADGHVPYSVCIYKEYEGVLEHSENRDCEELPGWKRREQNATSTGIDIICSMSSKYFKKVCKELFQPVRFSMYKLDEDDEPGECHSMEVIVYTQDGMSSLSSESKRVRKCPSDPEIFLSDGRLPYTVFVHKAIVGGLERIEISDGLKSLEWGGREKNHS